MRFVNYPEQTGQFILIVAFFFFSCQDFGWIYLIMKKLRTISIVLLSISSTLGLVRGFRMTLDKGRHSLLFPYSDEIIENSLFSTLSAIGWVVFFLVGVFSVVTLICTIKKLPKYPYLVIVEGIFSSFFTLTHIVYTQFSVIHLFVLPVCFGMIIIGVLQTPKEF